LLEYRRFKTAAALLEARAEAAAARFPRQPIADPSRSNTPLPIRAVEVWDLLRAFVRLMRDIQLLEKPTTVVVDDTPQHVHEALVLQRVREAGRITLRDVFDPPRTRARLIGLFLAVLELVKQRQITAEQDSDFGDIWLLAA
jgi:segregation and condensation protein A